MFDTVLVANRGEIACRIIGTLHAMGVRAVAVYSDADADARHVRLADEAVRLGPADARQSYLSIERLVAAARATGAQAVHPGYGFLAENADFARACSDAGIVFVGPPAAAIETMGDKIRARAAVEARGVATVPGLARPGLSDAELLAAAEHIGFPVLIKPSAGGGGKGMHRVDDAADLPAALGRARREAGAAFGDDTLFLERFVTNPRHIEVQVLADAHGHVVHLGERECSLQRRHQKVVEEAPSALLSAAQRERIGQAAVETARAVDYVGAGTVEFIVAGDRPDEPFFMEMNTRLQVEHPVTEMVTGVDLVREQLRIAAGEPLSFAQDDVRLTGHAVEARVYAEDPAAGFLPTGGEVLDVRLPVQPGVRHDSALQPGLVVSSDYDPMLAKVIAHAPTRAEALDRLEGALASLVLHGVTTNVDFLRRLVRHPAVVAGELDTGLLERELDGLTRTAPGQHDAAIAALLLTLHDAPTGAGHRWQAADGWRLGAPAAARHRFVDGDDVVEVRVSGTAAEATVVVGDGELVPAQVVSAGDGAARVRLGDRAWHVPFAVRETASGREVWFHRDGERVVVEHAAARGEHGAGPATPTVTSPMPGAVVALLVADGAEVGEGDPVVAVEAMKMEHVVRAGLAGTVRLSARVGEQVTRGQVLATITPKEDE